MAINQLTTSNTFGEWLIATQDVIAVANSVTDGAIRTEITTIYDHANSAYNHSNGTYSVIQSAYDYANSEITVLEADIETFNVTLYSNILTMNAYFENELTNLEIYVDDNLSPLYSDVSNAENTIIVIETHSNSAYDKINSSYVYANTILDYSNTILDYANTILDYANSINTFAHYASDNANTTYITIQGAYNNTNSIFSYANSILELTQSGYDQSNTIIQPLSSAYAHTNSAYDLTNTISSSVQSASDTANTSLIRTQSVYDYANTVVPLAQPLYDHANAAFDQANLDITSVSIISGTYGNTTHSPVLTVEANGRISSVSTIEVAAVPPSITTFNLLEDAETDSNFFIPFSNVTTTTSTLYYSPNFYYNPSLDLLTTKNIKINGSIKENVYTLTGDTIDPTNGTIQLITLTADKTLSQNFQTGESVLLIIDDGASDNIITWPTVSWTSGSAPIQGGVIFVSLWYADALYGSQI